LFEFARKNIEVTITMKHPIECFLGFAGLSGIEFDIVPAFSTAAGITQALGVAPDLDRLASDGATLGRGMTVAGGQVGVVDVHLAERTMDAEFFLHDDLLISEK
jgi:hypothetical protein